MHNDTEIAAIIAEMEKEEEFENITTEVTEPFEIPEEAIEEVAIVEEEVVEPIEEIIEDDILVEDRPPVEIPKYEVGDEVRLVPGATFVSGGVIPSNLVDSKLYVRQVKNNNCAIALKKTGRIAGNVAATSLIPYVKEIPVKQEDKFNNYLILVKAEDLNIKSRPDDSSKTLKTIHFNGLYTVVGEKDGWGHLKIGGWIPLDKVKRITF